jgi:hypothetical protein
MEERTSEIFKRLQKKQMEVVREAEEAEQKQEQLWREQGKGEAEGAEQKQEQLWKEQCIASGKFVRIGTKYWTSTILEHYQ